MHQQARVAIKATGQLRLFVSFGWGIRAQQSPQLFISFSSPIITPTKMTADIYEYTPLAITAKRRGYGKPYSLRHNRTARSVPVFPFDFIQAPPREFAPHTDSSIDQLEKKLRRLSLKPDDIADENPMTLAEERKRFEAEKMRFEADKRELESRVRVAEHKAVRYRRRYECMRQELEDYRQGIEDMQALGFKHLAEKEKVIEERDVQIANLLEDGRAVIQQKDEVIAALKAEAMHTQYPIQSQLPSQYTSHHAPSSQDEQYDPARPQFIPNDTHAAPAYSVHSQQTPSYQPQSHQDVSMDWSSENEGPSVQTAQASIPAVQLPPPGADKATNRAAIEFIFMQPKWRWWMVGIDVFHRCMWVYEDEPEILLHINEEVANALLGQVNAEAEMYRVDFFVPYAKQKMKEKFLRTGR